MASAAARQAPVTARLMAARAAGFPFEARKHTGTRPIHRTHLPRVLSWQRDEPDQSRTLIIRLLLGRHEGLLSIGMPARRSTTSTLCYRGLKREPSATLLRVVCEPLLCVFS